MGKIWAGIYKSFWGFDERLDAIRELSAGNELSSKSSTEYKEDQS